MYTTISNFIQITDMPTPISTRSARMQALLEQQLTPVWLELLNESSKHRVPDGSESHFKLTLVSSQFTGLSRIERHRLVNQLFNTERETGLHALSLHLYSPEEWAKHPAPPPTPPCHHQK